MKRFYYLLLLLFVVSTHIAIGQNRFKTQPQKPRLEIGVDLRNQSFLFFPFFPTTRLTIGVNNGKYSINATFYTLALTPEYLGTGIKYSWYKPLSKKYLLGTDAELSITKGKFAYNEFVQTGGYPYLDNKYCAALSVGLNLIHIINPKNHISFYSGIGGVYTFHKIEFSDSYTNVPRQYEDQVLGMQFQFGFTYKRLFKL
jgi:hypothetical protein